MVEYCQAEKSKRDLLNAEGIEDARGLKPHENSMR
jgi:hypothetical protein